jgi:hypothetical protein
VSQVVCLVHEDTLPDAHVTLNQLCHLATSSVRIGQSTQLSRGSPIASITHKKPGGKVVRHVSEILKYCYYYHLLFMSRLSLRLDICVCMCAFALI